MDRIIRRPRLAFVGTIAVLALALTASFVAFRTTAHPGSEEPLTTTPRWDRHILMNGLVIEVQKGKLYRLIQKGGTPARTLTPEQRKRHKALADRLNALLASPNRDENAAEIESLMAALRSPEFDVGGEWRSDGYYWFPLYEGQPQPPESEAIVVDFTDPNGPAPNPAWRYAQ